MMRISIVTGVIGALVVLGVRPASAEKLTLACTFESGDFDRERDVNQVIFDTDRPQVDLRVAQTMGTNIPVNWIFENNAERKDSIQMVSEGSKISVAAIRYGHAVVLTSFDRITGLLTWCMPLDRRMVTGSGTPLGSKCNLVFIRCKRNSRRLARL